MENHKLSVTLLQVEQFTTKMSLYNKKPTNIQKTKNKFKNKSKT